MSAQIKWTPPTMLPVEQGERAEHQVDSRHDNVTPIMLPGELQDGDDVISESSSNAESRDTVSEVAGWQDSGNMSGKKNRAFRWFIFLSLLFMLAVTVEDTILFITEQFARNSVLGWGFSLIAGGVGLALMILVVREIASYRALGKVHALQNRASKLRLDGGYGHGVRFSTTMMKFYKGREELEPGWKQFQDNLDSNLGDREVLTLFSANVLVTLDRKAYDIVVENSSIAALLTALSPMAWLDALLFLWRNVRMVRQIATCYGFRPGFMTSISLVKQVLAGMVVSATTDFLTNEAVESVGNSVTAVLFAKAGQGMANGLLSARIGIQAMRLCRPVAFCAEENPSLKRVRGKVIERVKNRMG
jgi:putative membrane protein